MSNELTINQNKTSEIYAKVDNPLEFAMKLGEQLYQSGMFGLQSAAAGTVIMLQCQCEGITPFEHLRKYHMIENKPTMRSDAMLAEFRTTHGAKTKVIESTSDRAAIWIDFQGEQAEYSVTWEEMKQSRWPWKKFNVPESDRELKANWSTPMDRKDMLWSRLISSTIRKICPELVAGIYSPDEIRDVVGEVIESVPARPVEEARQVITPIEPQPPKTEPVGKEEPSLQLQIHLQSLVNQVGVSQQQFNQVLEARGAKDISDLTPEQCQELVTKLETKMAEIKAVKNG